MFKPLKKNKGQAFLTEYAIIFFLVFAVISTMTVYFQRTLQSRIRETRFFMAQTVNEMIQSTPPSVSGNLVGNLLLGYEPYYLNSESDRFSESTHTERVLPSLPASSGIYQIDIDDRMVTQSFSNQLPAKDAD